MLSRLKEKEVLDTLMFGTRMDYSKNQYIIDKTQPSPYLRKLFDDALSSEALKTMIDKKMSIVVEKMCSKIENNFDDYLTRAFKEMFIQSLNNNGTFKRIISEAIENTL